MAKWAAAIQSQFSDNFGGGGPDGSNGSGAPNDPFLAAALSANTAAAMDNLITPHSAGLFPEFGYLGSNFNGATVKGSPSSGNYALVISFAGSSIDGSSTDFLHQTMNSTTVGVLTISLGNIYNGISNGFIGFMNYFGSFNFGFGGAGPGLFPLHYSSTTIASSGHSPFPGFSLSKFFGNVYKTGNGIITGFETTENGAVTTLGYGLDFGDKGSVSINADLENGGAFLDVGLGKFDIVVGLSLMKGLTIGHSFTTDGGAVDGLNASFNPFTPFLAQPADNPSPAFEPEPVPIFIP